MKPAIKAVPGYSHKSLYSCKEQRSKQFGMKYLHQSELVKLLRPYSFREMDDEGSYLLTNMCSSNGPPNDRTARCEIDDSAQ